MSRMSDMILIGVAQDALVKPMQPTKVSKPTGYINESMPVEYEFSAYQEPGGILGSPKLCPASTPDRPLTARLHDRQTA